MTENLENIPLGIMTNDLLEELRQTLELSMSQEDLLLCREHYKSKGYVSISPALLQMLDKISDSARKNAQNILITKLQTDNKDIFETYLDLAHKRSIVAREQNAPLPLSEAHDVANEYTKISRKRTPRLLSINDIYGDSGKPLFPVTDELCKASVELAPTTAFLLMYPAEPMSGAKYLRAVEDFLSCDGIADKAILTRRISRGGIAATLADVCSGVLADIKAIPEMPEEVVISHLVSEHHGRFILALGQMHIEFASAIAEYYGLSLAYFAKAILGERLVFIPSNGISDTVDTQLIRALSSLPIQQEAHIKEDIDSRSAPIPLVEARRGHEAHPVPYGSLHLRGDSVSTACASHLGGAPFTTSIETAIAAILPILASGISRADISLKLRYTLSDTLNQEAIGESLSAMLGIYRVMSELYLSGESSAEYTSNDSPSVAVAAFAPATSVRVLNKLIGEHSGVYLLSFDRTESGLPNFENFRAMCDFYLECVKNKHVLSATAVNGSISDALTAMKSNLACDLADSANQFLNKSVYGIIVESPVPLRHGVFLGSTARATDLI